MSTTLKGNDPSAIIGARVALVDALTSPTAYPPKVSTAQFFRENGTLIAALRQRGWSVPALVELIARSGVSISARSFSDHLSKNKPKGRDDLERRLAGHAGETLVEEVLAAQAKPFRREAEPTALPHVASPRLVPMRAESRKSATPAARGSEVISQDDDDNASVPSPQPIADRARERAPATAPMASAAEVPAQSAPQAARGTDPLRRASLPAALRPRAASDSAIELPGVVQGVRIDRAEPFERDRTKSALDFEGGKPPREWLIEACAISAFNKRSGVAAVVLRNGAQIALSSSDQAKVLNGTYEF